METLRLPNNLFFEHIAQELANGEKVLIQAKGNSMQPFIRDKKDKIVLTAIDRPLKKGMIVLAKHGDGNFVIHRIEKMYKDSVVLRGDGNLYARETCSTENVSAIVTTVLRGEKKIHIGDRNWNLYRYLCPSSPFLRKIVLAIYYRLKRT